MGGGSVRLLDTHQAIQVISEAARHAHHCVDKARDTDVATAERLCCCTCRSTAVESQRVKAHLSDPDIESKAQAALAETVTLITHNGGGKQAAASKQPGGLTSFWRTPLFRCGPQMQLCQFNPSLSRASWQALL